jgi:hypothetical protein
MVILIFLVVKATSLTGFYRLPVEFFIMLGIPTLTLVLLTSLQLTKKKGLIKTFIRIFCFVLILVGTVFLLYLFYTAMTSVTLVMSSGFGILMALGMIPLLITSITMMIGIAKGKI